MHDKKYILKVDFSLSSNTTKNCIVYNNYHWSTTVNKHNYMPAHVTLTGMGSSRSHAELPTNDHQYHTLMPLKAESNTL